MSFGWNKDGSKLIILTYVSYGRHVAMKSIEPYIPNHLVLEGIKDRSKLVIGICIYIYICCGSKPFSLLLVLLTAAALGVVGGGIRGTLGRCCRVVVTRRRGSAVAATSFAIRHWYDPHRSDGSTLVSSALP